jgi:predicted transcriptional regulator of viral defense system
MKKFLTLALAAALFVLAPVSSQAQQTFPNYINGLPAARSLGATDKLYVLQGGTSKSIAGNLIGTSSGNLDAVFGSTRGSILGASSWATVPHWGGSRSLRVRRLPKSFAQSIKNRYFMHMISNSHRLRARGYIDALTAAGRYHFSTADVRKALGVSADATKQALSRLAQQKLISSPAKGFYVVVPPEYRSLGCLPADQFIAALMERSGLRYYAGLLSAAQFHGAAHHRPQEFQVLLEKPRRPIQCGQVRVAFIVRKHLENVAVQAFNTPRGTIQVSTPEATAMDLVGYYRHAGGLDQVATILGELSERINPDKLVAAAKTAPVPWAQRLGYLLELVGASGHTASLKNYVRNEAREPVPLLPGAKNRKAHRDAGWKLIVNAEVEAEV